MSCSVEFSMNKLLFFPVAFPRGYSDVFMHTYDRLGSFLEVQNFEFQYFMVLSQEVYFQCCYSMKLAIDPRHIY